MAKKDFTSALTGGRKSRLSGIVSSPEQETEAFTQAEVSVATPIAEVGTTHEPEIAPAEEIDPFPLIPEEAMEELRRKAASYPRETFEDASGTNATAQEKSHISKRKAAEPKESKEKMNLFIETNIDFGVRVRAAAAMEMMDLKEFVETALTHYMNEVIGTSAVNRAVVKYKERNKLK